MGIAGDTQAIMKQDECPKFKERPDSDEERKEREREKNMCNECALQSIPPLGLNASAITRHILSPGISLVTYKHDITFPG